MASKETYIGVMHIYIAHKLRDKLPFSIDIMPREEAKEILHRHNIPKSLYINFLQEMEKFKLIKRVNKQKIRILVKKTEGLI